MSESPVQAVLFDAGNTLVYPDAARMAEIMVAAGARTDADQVRHAELEARRLLHDAIADGHKGTEPEVWRDYFVAVFRGSGVPSEAMGKAGRLLREVHAERHLWTHVADGTPEVLLGLADQGFRLGVISNADGRIEALLESVGLRHHFEFVLDSQVLGVEKPDPVIFLEGCRRMDLPPGRCLYVGDLYPVDYVGAVEAGLRGVLIDPLDLFRGRAPRVGSLAGLPSFLEEVGARRPGAGRR